MRTLLRYCGPHLVPAAMFSLFINLLVLIVPLYMLQVYDRVLASRSAETLVMLSLIAMFGLLLHAGLDGLRTRLMLCAGIAFENQVAPLVLRETFRLAGRPGRNPCVGGARDVATVRGFMTSPSINTLFDAPWLPLYLLVIFAFHWLLGTIATCGAAILFAFAYYNEKVTRARIEVTADDARQAGRYIDACMRNAETANALGMVTHLTAHWQQRNAKVVDGLISSSRSAAWFAATGKFIRSALQIMMIGVGAWLVVKQQAAAGVMITGTLVLARALAPLETAIVGWKALVEARHACKRIAAVVDGCVESEPRLHLPVPQGRIDVERLVCGVPGIERPILKSVSFSLNPGDSLAIVGPSASGKSTLARLVAGVWRGSSGSVRLDGADIAQWPRELLGPHIGYLPQAVELFPGTVAQNIARFADGDGELVIAAARAAHVHEMILRLPQGYDTEVGDGGTMLSGGQRQRIGLARALYGSPRLIVLDEPNAHLDADAERALLAVFDELKQHKVTVIAVSHRTVLSNHVDKLLVLKEGLVEHFGARSDVVQWPARPAESSSLTKFPQLVQGGL